MGRLKQFSKKKPCYYCGAPPPSTKEHAPPKLFLDGSDCDKITVPSCDCHNTSKSGSDRAILTALVRGVDQMVAHGLRTQAMPEATRRLIDAVRPNFRRANGGLSMRRLLADAPRDLDFDLPFIHAHVEIESWVTKLTAALCWSVVGEYDPKSDWEGAWSWSPDYLSIKSPAPVNAARNRIAEKRWLRQVLEEGTWWPGWSPQPKGYPADIYHFEVSVEPQRPTWKPSLVFRHSFLESFTYYTWFLTSDRTLGAILDQFGATAPEQNP